MFHQLLLPPPVQVTLLQEMGPRRDHTATVFGSGPNFRMVVMFGGNRKLYGERIAATTLLHLGECSVWNITCYMSRNIHFGKVPISGAVAAEGYHAIKVIIHAYIVRKISF